MNPAQSGQTPGQTFFIRDDSLKKLCQVNSEVVVKLESTSCNCFISSGSTFLSASSKICSTGPGLDVAVSGYQLILSSFSVIFSCDFIILCLSSAVLSPSILLTAPSTGFSSSSFICCCVSFLSCHYFSICPPSSCPGKISVIYYQTHLLFVSSSKTSSWHFMSCPLRLSCFSIANHVMTQCQGKFATMVREHIIISPWKFSKYVIY